MKLKINATFIENFREGTKSLRANFLRSSLTAAIIAIGIMSLVGILTAIDGLQKSIEDSFKGLGVNSFSISSKTGRGNRGGVEEKSYPIITFKETKRFKELYDFPSDISISTWVTGTAEVKHSGKKTNPNSRLIGGNEHYLIIEGWDLARGRNFSNIEVQYGTNVAIIGSAIKDALFEDFEEPLGSEISVLGVKYRVIGIMAEKGSFSGGGADRSVIIPVINASRVATRWQLRYSMEVAIDDPTRMEFAMGEATGLMRSIRRDQLGNEDSFRLERSETLAEELDEISGYMKAGGFGIGIITLLGASIGLMNIMMVSVTERTREIGVRKALGATPTRIRQQFIIEAIVVCLFGGVGGVLFGIGIGNLISILISEGGFVVPWVWVFMGFAICVVVGMVSGYYPAYKASKLDPIESLRFE